MEHKQVIFVADSLDNAYKFQHGLSGMEIDVTAASSAQFKKMLAQKTTYDLVVFEVHKGEFAEVAKLETALSGLAGTAMLLIIPEEMLYDFRLPMQVKCDFAVSSASEAECATRVRQLLWPGDIVSASDFITIDSMTINLATYQVTVNGEPLDLTYLEYALLSFLAAHPNRT